MLTNPEKLFKLPNLLAYRVLALCCIGMIQCQIARWWPTVGPGIIGIGQIAIANGRITPQKFVDCGLLVNSRIR